ncbi:MAG: hypothetical protein SFU86_00140 [Pirellulaceae bacterium]|nr:hypothetical protein [Pirellulaceae bacterium]
MKLYPNQAGGQTVELSTGDDLDEVPESHRDLVSDTLRQAFADPPTWFREIAERSTIPELSQWLTALIANAQWRLLLHEGFMYDRSTLAAFCWHSTTVTSAMVSLPATYLSPRLPEGLRGFHSLVDSVHWDAFGYAGGVLGSQSHIPLTAFDSRPKKKGFNPQQCVVWGNSSCGDLLIYTQAGKAGFLSHESGKVQSLGTIDEAIRWVFQQLLANQTPEFDYSKA